MSQSPLSKIFFAVIWILLLWFVAWPLAGFFGSIWILLQPFEALWGPIKDVNKFCEGFVTWPRGLGEAIVSGSNVLPKPTAGGSGGFEAIPDI